MRSSIEIRETTIADKIDEANALLVAHWQELAKNKDVMVLKPDVERYALLEAAGSLVSLVAYDGDRIVGYSVNFLTTNLHYSDLTYVHNDVLFVMPEHRKSSLGMRLIRATEDVARQRGARMVIWHAKEQTALAEILPRLGYGVQDILFSKVL